MSSDKNALLRARVASLPVPIVVLSRLSASQLTGYGKHLRNSKLTCQSASKEDNLTDTGNKTHVERSRDGITMPSPSEDNLSVTPESCVENPNQRNENMTASPGGPANIFRCPYCTRYFSTLRGLGVHKKSQHPIERNEEIDVTRKKPRWQDEDLRRLAMEEARAPPSTRFMNEYLLDNVKMYPARSAQAISSLRRKPAYKEMVESYKAAENANENLTETPSPDSQPESLTIEATPNIEPESIPRVLVNEVTEIIAEWLQDAIKYLNTDGKSESGRFHLLSAIHDVLYHRSPELNLELWFQTRFRRTDGMDRPPQPQERPRIPMSKRARRRFEYKSTQKLWSKNMSKAAKKILDGDVEDQQHPSLEQQETFWRNLLTEQSKEFEQTCEPTPAKMHEEVLRPISVTECKKYRPDHKTAAGPDGLKAKNWLDNVSNMVKATIMNVMLLWGQTPKIWRDSRTVLIPKEAGTMDPAKFRPISISSIVLRHFHRVLAGRLTDLELFDKRQRAFIRADGIAENSFVLSSVLDDSWKNLRQLHVAAIDVRKAFDTVSHKALPWILLKNGIPHHLVDYVVKMYDEAQTQLEVDGRLSNPIQPGQGVRQGDPLSSIIFNLVMNEIIGSVGDGIGYRLGHSSINVLAFADDLLLLARTKEGLQDLIDAVIDEMKKYGLAPMPKKCCCLSLVPNGKAKLMKVMSQQLFQIDNEPVPQLGISDYWKQLGVVFGAKGPNAPIIQMNDLLGRVTRAPLKPQQRMKILQTFLLPRFMHKLTFGKLTHGALRRMDKQIRKVVKEWCKLPHDVPSAYFYAPAREGGLGITCLATKIPELVMKRINSLGKSNFPAAVEAGKSLWAHAKRKWCCLTSLRDRDWSNKLHRSTDGFDLREARNSAASYQWISDPYIRIPARDWIQFIRLRINALPSRMRTSRGVRRANLLTECRAGCKVPETTYHTIQGCHRTHGGRIERHNALVNATAKKLSSIGYKVEIEKQYRTNEGVRKPDITAKRDNKVIILDAQVVAAHRNLDESHKLKRDKYKMNNSLISLVSGYHNVPRSSVDVSTITISWRGIWSGASSQELRALGLNTSFQTSLTTRVLQGSHTNFNRFNKMTTMATRDILRNRPP